MSNTFVPWDRIYNYINRRLPEWARYEGHATYALGAYAYTVLLGLLAYYIYTNVHSTFGMVLGGLAIVGVLIGDYYRKAAKARVTCNHCGEAARGESKCPHCGAPTFMDGDTA